LGLEVDMFENKKKAILGIILTIFVASLIIFDLSHNVKYNNILNILFLVVFVAISLIERNYKIELPDILIAYFLFAIFAFSSIFWAVDFMLGFKYYTRLIIVTLDLIVLYTVFERYNLEQTILYGILLGGLYNILIGFNIIHPSYEIFEFGRFTGTLGNSNKLAKTMLLVIFSSLVLLSLSTTKGWFKIYHYISIILSFYIIILTVSKKAMILAPLMILLSFSFKNLKIKNILIFALLLYVGVKLLFIYGDIAQLESLSALVEKRFVGMMNMIDGSSSGDASSKERAYLIYEGLNIFENNPVFGIGLNNARYFLGKYTHNNYLELLIGVGILGTMLFYTVYLFTIRNIYMMPQVAVKKYFYVMIFILLLLDIATVTYYTKPILFLVLYINFVAQKRDNQGESCLQKIVKK
jgi:O-antigen ligase